MIETLELNGSLLLMGGDFTEVSGISRNRIAALSTQTLALADWYPLGGADASVKSIRVISDRVYIGGFFSSFAGQPRVRIAAVELNSSLSTWYPLGGVSSATATFLSSIASLGSEIFFGGRFRTVGPEDRGAAASINASSVLSSWNPSFNLGNEFFPDSNFQTETMAVNGTMLFVG